VVFVDRPVDQALNDVAEKHPDTPDQHGWTATAAGVQPMAGRCQSLHPVLFSPRDAVSISFYFFFLPGTLGNPRASFSRTQPWSPHPARHRGSTTVPEVRHSDFYTAVSNYTLAALLPSIGLGGTARADGPSLMPPSI